MTLLFTRHKIILAIAVLAALTIGGVAAVSRPSHGNGFVNLKILPKDIAPVMLDSIMDSYNKALGVNCAFCHSSPAGFPDSLDFASDQNSMKANAREMMLLTIDINKKYFYFDKRIKPVYLNRVHCNTCHKGAAYPED